MSGTAVVCDDGIASDIRNTVVVVVVGNAELSRRLCCLRLSDDAVAVVRCFHGGVSCAEKEWTLGVEESNAISRKRRIIGVGAMATAFGVRGDDVVIVVVVN